MNRISLLALLVTTTIALQAQPEWTPELIMKYKDIQSTEVSADGKYVAYVVRSAIMEGEKSEYNSQVWVAATEGSMDVQYTRGEKSSTNPAFSPNSQQIAFLSNRVGDENQLFVMRLMGGEPEQITEAKSGVNSFKWAPDGKSIAYVSRDPETDEDEKARKEKRDIILVDQNYKYNHLYRIALDKSEDGRRPTKQLTSGKFNVNSFDWTPDGRTIAFSYSPDPTINSIFLESDIATVPSDSGAIKTLVERPGHDGSPHYSPDGQWVAFQSHGGQPEPVGLQDIYLVPSQGGDVKPLPKTPDQQAEIVAWSEDGTFLYVKETYKTSQTFMALPVEASGAGLVGDYMGMTDSTLPILTSLDGSANHFSVSQAGKVITYLFEGSDLPGEVYSAGLKGENPKMLSRVNQGFRSMKYGKTEVISWKSKDDLEIEGILTYPLDYQEDKKYPIVLQVHGGPGGVFTKSFSGKSSRYMVQYFAQKGYIMLQPNPRGSRGYGKEFRYANVKDWGFGDYEDLLAGVDHVIDMGIADPDKQFVMGWSYGGYMTSWIVTQTNRFNAASMGAGLPNLISMVSTTDIPDYVVAHLGGREFWEDYEEYEKHSAIYHIAKVKTPTQVIHGANDPRVPFSQGQEFYNALKRLGVDTEMVVYPRTPHGPQEPKLRRDVAPRVMNWFEKYLN